MHIRLMFVPPLFQPITFGPSETFINGTEYRNISVPYPTAVERKLVKCLGVKGDVPIVCFGGRGEN